MGGARPTAAPYSRLRGGLAGLPPRKSTGGCDGVRIRDASASDGWADGWAPPMTAIESSLEPIWVWVVGAVGVACLVAAVLVSVLGSRRRTKSRNLTPPPQPNGAGTRLPRSNRPSEFRVEP